MPVKIQKGDLTITVEGESDLKAVMSLLGFTGAGTDTQIAKASHHGANNSPTDEPEELGSKTRTFAVALPEFLTNLKQHSVQLLGLLYHSRNGATDTQIREVLGLDSNLQLAGMLSGIVKAAKKVGMPSIYPVLREDYQDTFGSLYRYSLSDGFRQAVDEAGEDILSDVNP